MTQDDLRRQMFFGDADILVAPKIADARERRRDDLRVDLTERAAPGHELLDHPIRSFRVAFAQRPRVFDLVVLQVVFAFSARSEWTK